MRFTALFIAFLSALVGCESTPPASEPGGSGLSLKLYVRDQSGGEELYEVHRNGTISYGGGLKARFDSTIWTGEMTPEEIDEVNRLVREHRLVEQDPRSTNEPAEHRYRVEIISAEGRNTFTIKGESPEVRPVYEALRKIALRRLEPELQKLPKPSIETQK